MIDKKEMDKEAILNYKRFNPDAFDIECRLELGMGIEEYVKLRDELVKEGILVKRGRRSYTVCQDADGNITRGWVGE